MLPVPVTVCASELDEEAALRKHGPDDVSEL